MGSKRSKKSKQDLELFSEKNNIKKNKEKDDELEPQLNDFNIEHDDVAPKAQKRKKKSEGIEEVPKKIKKTTDNGNVPKKARPRKRKVKSTEGIENVENEGQLMMNGETQMQMGNIEKNNKNTDKKKEDMTWPDQDITELINRMESNIPEKDVLAYRSRVEKMDWDNVAFKNYTAEECKKTWMQVQKRIRRYRLLSEILNDAKEWVSTPRTNHRAPRPNHRAPRPKKHPDKPRRPLSSYLLFYLSQKDQIISENPGLEGSDLTKLMGQIYKTLPPENREKYEKLAASNKEEYVEKLKIFFEKHPDLVPPTKVNHKVEKEKAAKIEKALPKVEKDKALFKVEKEKAPPKIEKEKAPPKIEKEKPPPKVEKEKAPKMEKEKAPKVEKEKVPKEKLPKLEKDRLPKPEKAARPGRPPKNSAKALKESPPKKCQTPFGLFYASEFNNMEQGMEKHVFREKCKGLYRQMSDKKKVYWINLAEQDLIRYQDEVKIYKEKHPEFEVIKIRPILTKREKMAKERALGKPVKPPNSAYALYSRRMLQGEDIKSVHPKDRMNFIANQWKNAPEEEKDTYKDHVINMMEQYKLEFASYLESLPEEEKRKLIAQTKKRTRKSGSRPNRIRKPSERKSAKKESKQNKPPPKKLKFTEPEQPPISACKYFATLHTGEGDPVQAWKALSPDEKRKYEEELVKKKQAYIVEFEKFLKSLSKEELEAFSKSRQQVKSDDDDDDDESSDCSSGSEGEDEDNVEDDEENDDVPDSSEIGHQSGSE